MSGAGGRGGGVGGVTTPVEQLVPPSWSHLSPAGLGGGTAPVFRSALQRKHWFQPLRDHATQPSMAKGDEAGWAQHLAAQSSVELISLNSQPLPPHLVLHHPVPRYYELGLDLVAVAVA